MTRFVVVFICGVLLGAVVLGVPSVLLGKEEDPHAKFGRNIAHTPEAQAEMMKKWQAVATPGKAHERLAYFLGKWQIESKMWMGGEGSGEPMVSKGEATFRWLMEGRWMAQEFSGSIPMMGAYNGFGISGYDNFRKQYVGCWVDSMGTALLNMSGSIDRTGRVIEQFGSMDEPMLDQVGKIAKYVTRITGDDSFAFEIHDLDIIGGNTKVLEMTYTRVKAPTTK
jgi:Protein of unknown function (DUF1579)